MTQSEIALLVTGAAIGLAFGITLTHLLCRKTLASSRRYVDAMGNEIRNYRMLFENLLARYRVESGLRRLAEEELKLVRK